MSIVALVSRGQVCPTAGVRRAVRHAWVLALAAALTLAPASMASAGDDPAFSSDANLEQIDKALLQTYWHGVTLEIANSEVGAAGVPRILEHLRDPAYPRRDNLVAFLFFLDGEGVRDGLLSAFTDRGFSVTVPEEDRARMMIPQALGMQASRGDQKALEVLMSISEGGERRGLLDQAASAYSDAAGARVDLMEDVLRGLAYSGDESARDRLVDIAFGRVPGLPAGRDLGGPALDLLDVMEELKIHPFGTHGEAQGEDPDAAGFGPDPQGQSYLVEFAEEQSVSGNEAVSPLEFDTQYYVHENRLTYANHVDLPGTDMYNARLDDLLQEATWRAGRSDYSGDVACCSTVVRQGDAKEFGSPGDGLDRIDNSYEGGQVIGNTTARVKVVRQINWCGDTGAGIIGCAYTPGFGMALVRMSDLGTEAVLWIHEYGHNTGLQHASQSNRIMYGTDTGYNRGLSQSECNSYHSPSSLANALNEVVSTCADNDGDTMHNWVDNCPDFPSSNQLDGDEDGVGDVCDNCNGLFNPDQANYDGDAMGDLCDDDDDNDGVVDGLDCAPTDVFAAYPANPAENVGWSAAGNLTWQKGAYAAQSNIYRAAAVVGAPAGWSCLRSGFPFTSLADTGEPPAGEGFSYVISGINSCGESNAGWDSDGVPRYPTPCP